MEVVTMEKKAFDLMMARYDALVKKVELLKHKANGKRLVMRSASNFASASAPYKNFVTAVSWGIPR